jgi:hypothetical protein
MVSRNDERVELARLQKEIQDFLGLSSDNFFFEYSTQQNKVKLDLITVNPRHNQSFLFHSTIGVDKLDALQKMTEYIKSYRSVENSYTVQWMSKEDKQLHTSYFSAKNIYEALDKLYYGRDMNTITVYIVKLNPLS